MIITLILPWHIFGHYHNEDDGHDDLKESLWLKINIIHMPTRMSKGTTFIKKFLTGVVNILPCPTESTLVSKQTKFQVYYHTSNLPCQKSSIDLHTEYVPLSNRSHTKTLSS